jgi:phenylacetate-CoA ligase
LTAYGVRLLAVRRGRHYWEWTRFLRESAGWSRDRLEAYQAERLRSLVEHARRHSPFYRDRLAGLEVRTTADLRQVEPVDKETFRRELDSIHTIASGVSVHTGGTTGTPLQVLFTKADVQERMATLDEWRARHGVNRWARRATFSGRIVVAPGNTGGGVARTNLALGQRLYSSFHLQGSRLEEYARDLARFQPGMIDGFPSAISMVAAHLAATGRSGSVRPRAVFTTSENLYEHQRALIGQAFGCPVRNQYASAEGAPFVTECERGALHSDLRTGVIEQGDEGILVTSFTTAGTPLIRYRIGDRMDLTEGRCDCGDHNPVIAGIAGREQDYVVSPERGMVGVGLIDIFKKIPPVVKQAQVDQVASNELLVRLVPDRLPFDEQYLDVLREGLAERVGRSMAVRFDLVDRIDPEPGGKVRYVKRSCEISRVAVVEREADR